MSSIKNITKTKYDKITKDPLCLVEYITFTSNDETKYTIFKFYNGVNQYVTKFQMEVREYDSDGFLLKESTLNLSEKLAPATYVVPKAKFELQKETIRLEVKVLEVFYERIQWINGEFEPIPYSKDDFKKDSYNDRVGVSKTKNESTNEIISKKNKNNKVVVKNITKTNRPKSVLVLTIIMAIILIAGIIGGGFYYKSQFHEYFDGTVTYTILSEDNKTCEITSYDSNDVDLKLDETIDGYTIKSIKSGAFSGSKFETITLNLNDTEIENEAFKDSKNLKKLTINGSGVIIDESAFEGSVNLELAEISGVSKIYKNAFKDCDKLYNINAENATLYNSSLNGLNKLKNLTYYDSASSLKFADLFGDSKITVTNLTTSRSYISASYFNNVSTITYLNAPNANYEYGALDNLNLNNITIYSGITIYGNYVGVDPSQKEFILNNIFTSSQIEKIFDNINFINNCEKLTINYYSGNLTSTDINKLTNLKSLTLHGVNLSDNILEGNTSITSLTVSDNYVSDLSSDYVEDLTITSSGSYSNLGFGSLSGFNKLKTVSMPLCYSTLQELGLTTNVSEVNLTFNSNITWLNGNYLNGYNNIKEFVIPSGITTIYSNAISNCTNLEKLIVPSTVTYIDGGNLIGEGCYSLSYVEVPFVGSSSSSSSSYKNFNASYSATKALIITGQTYGGSSFSTGLENVVYLSFKASPRSTYYLLSNCSNLKYLEMTGVTISTSISSKQLYLEWLYLNNSYIASSFNNRLLATNVYINSTSNYDSNLYSYLYSTNKNLYCGNYGSLNYTNVTYNYAYDFKSLITY